MHPARWWHQQEERFVCDLCPRACNLRAGQRGYCQVRRATESGLVMDVYGQPSAVAVDPVEKKPLNHFLPGTHILSIGTQGCNLGCVFCQNWQLTKEKGLRPVRALSPQELADLALAQGCQSVAFTYNDPVIFAEYALDAARRCRQAGLKTVAVTAGYIQEAARIDFFDAMDATNVDLKSFSDEFYQKNCSARLKPVLDTLVYLRQHTKVWLEVTHLLIPGLNDDAAETRELCQWMVAELGAQTPLHLSAFHPDYKLRDRQCTSTDSLFRAQSIAKEAGLKFVYLGNVQAPERGCQDTSCPSCSVTLVQREGYYVKVLDKRLLKSGCCTACGAQVAGLWG